MRRAAKPDPREVLRQREPFLVVDRVTSVRPGESLTASWRVPDDWPVLRGHFPGEPIVPGVVLVEAVAQASALLAWTTERFEPERARMYLLAVDRARFDAMTGPGDRLRIRTRLADRRGPVWRFDGTVERGRTRVAEARVTAALFPEGRPGTRRTGR